MTPASITVMLRVFLQLMSHAGGRTNSEYGKLDKWWVVGMMLT
jgi:hypothetical protein